MEIESHVTLKIQKNPEKKQQIQNVPLTIDKISP